MLVTSAMAELRTRRRHIWRAGMGPSLAARELAAAGGYGERTSAQEGGYCETSGTRLGLEMRALGGRYPELDDGGEEALRCWRFVSSHGG